MSYELPQLPYAYDALEPVIHKDIMELHHKKHHQGYVTNLNAALEKYKQAEQKNEMDQMIALQQAIKFNGGGHVNHCLFWNNLAPKNHGSEPSSDLIKAVEKDFSSLSQLIEQLSAKTVAIQGSGWGWLALDTQKKVLSIATTANQDPLSTQGLMPLIGIDVWEHAYYLQYKNVRADYVKAIWQIIDWKNVNKRFEVGMAK